MKVAILCGGRGTRIRGVDENLPKAMIHVGEKPILQHIMNHYDRSGHREFVLCVGFRSESIINYFSDIATLVSHEERFRVFEYVGLLGEKCQVSVVDTGLETMTGGRLYQSREFLNQSTFFLTYGDGLSDVNLEALFDFHEKSESTMTLTAVYPPARFGEVRYDSSGLVSAFNEKPQASGGRISGGFFVCKPDIFRYLTDDPELVLETVPMQQMVKDERLSAYQHDGFWQCMDTFRDWELLNQYSRDGKLPWL